MKSKSNAETKVTVHRVPPPLCRRRVENDGKREWRPTGKTTSRVKSGEPAHVTPLASANDFDTLFAKLDPTDEVQANRMQQRRKQVTMGKNTAGYECYLQQVPKSSRKPRSMDTPSTPDHTLDVPAKRWAGIVRAWRVALHKYDPPDLVTNKPISEEPKKADIFAAVPVVTRRTQQLEEAEAQGLLVDFGPAQSLDSGTMDAGSPISVMTQSSKCSLIDEFSSARNLSDDEDSDDDLL